MKNRTLFLILSIIIIIFAIAIIVMLNREDNTSNPNLSNTNNKQQQEGDLNMSNINNSSNISFNFETKTVKLNSGYEMPILGLGTWTQDDEETANSVYYALEDRYRLIDTAQYYGNEKGVGDGLKRARYI